MPFPNGFFTGKALLMIIIHQKKRIYFFRKGVQCFLGIKFVSSTVLCMHNVLVFWISNVSLQFLSLSHAWMISVKVWYSVWLEQPCTWCFVIHIKAALIQVSNCYLIMSFVLSAWFHQVLIALLLRHLGQSNQEWIK